MKSLFVTFTILLAGCSTQKQPTPAAPYIMVLGVAQDAGYPQINCTKACCKTAWQQPALRRMTACLAIVDPATKQQWIIDATPDIKNQLQLLKTKTLWRQSSALAGDWCRINLPVSDRSTTLQKTKPIPAF